MFKKIEYTQDEESSLIPDKQHNILSESGLYQVQIVSDLNEMNISNMDPLNSLLDLIDMHEENKKTWLEFSLRFNPRKEIYNNCFRVTVLLTVLYLVILLIVMLPLYLFSSEPCVEYLYWDPFGNKSYSSRVLQFHSNSTDSAGAKSPISCGKVILFSIVLIALALGNALLLPFIKNKVIRLMKEDMLLITGILQLIYNIGNQDLQNFPLPKTCQDAINSMYITMKHSCLLIECALSEVSTDFNDRETIREWLKIEKSNNVNKLSCRPNKLKINRNSLWSTSESSTGMIVNTQERSVNELSK